MALTKSERKKYSGAAYDDDEKLLTEDDYAPETVERENARINQERSSRPSITTKPIGDDWNESEVKAIEAAAEAKQAQDERRERVASAQKTLGIYKPTKKEIVDQQNENYKKHLINSEIRLENIAENEELRVDNWHQKLDEARDRRISANMKIALAEPGRYSSTFTNFARQEHQRNKLQAHELRMAETEGELAVKKEIEHAKGLRGQGAEAARINADANMSIAETQAKSSKDVAGINAKSSLDVANANNASLLERTKIEQASHEKIAGIQADAAKYGADTSVDVQTEKNKGEFARTLAEQAKVDQVHNNKMNEIAQRESLRQANNAEIKEMDRLRRNPMYKDLPPNQLLALIRMGTSSAD